MILPDSEAPGQLEVEAVVHNDQEGVQHGGKVRDCAREHIPCQLA